MPAVQAPRTLDRPIGATGCLLEGRAAELAQERDLDQHPSIGGLAREFDRPGPDDRGCPCQDLLDALWVNKWDPGFRTVRQLGLAPHPRANAGGGGLEEPVEGILTRRPGVQASFDQPSQARRQRSAEDVGVRERRVVRSLECFPHRSDLARLRPRRSRDNIWS